MYVYTYMELYISAYPFRGFTGVCVLLELSPSLNSFLIPTPQKVPGGG